VTMDPSEPRGEGAPPSEPMGTPPPPQGQMPPQQGQMPPPQGQMPPPPQQSWQSSPQQPAPPPPPGGGMMAQATPLPPGPIAGTTIADFITRLVAFIIDSVILGIANYIVWAVLGALLLSLGGLSILLHAVIILAISAGYFIYFWTTRRQTPGMILMKLLVVEDGTGATLTQPQAIKRWMFLGLPLALSTLLSVGGGLGGFALGGLGGLFFLFTLATIAGLIALVWEIYLAYTTYQDPRKQGVHDKSVNSVVVSYGPSPFNQSAR
jgi:uncharacterized RDD family membrane protein YckC